MIFFRGQVSKTTIFIGLLIIISASFARQLMSLLKAYIGEAGFTILIGLILAGAGLAFLIFIIKRGLSRIKTLGFVLVLIIGLAFAWQIRIPEERIHILEYGILGWFALRDLAGKEKKIKAIILACVFCTVIGILDEVFQAILPYRYFDLRDIGFNSLGGVWGTVLYLLGTTKTLIVT